MARIAEKRLPRDETRSGPKIGSFFLSNAKSYLVTAKQLMRRIRDKVPYSSGDKMMLSNAGSGWMVEGGCCATTTSWSRPITAAPISNWG